MTFALVVALLVAAMAVSAVVLVQAFWAHAENTRLEQQRAVTELATEVGGVVTPRMVAQHLGISPLQADRLLKGMVDEVHLTFSVDDRAGELRFEFPRLTQDPASGNMGAYIRVRGR
ncbi:MAG: hypothetical protein KC933_05995 [Myxococcales bacterium]|nr:hypothetical protein [Myxococcales bacterium]